MEFERDAPVGPTGLQWRAWLLAHGAFPPGEHVWSRSRRQREVWSRFLHQLGRVLVVLYGPRAGTQRIVGWLTSRGKSRPPRGHIAQFWAIKCRRDPRGLDRIGRCDGIAPRAATHPRQGRRRHGP